MAIYQAFFKHVLFPGYERFLKRRNTHVYLAEYTRSQFFSAEKLEQLQLAKLNQLLDHCWRTVPFLREFWSSTGLLHRPLANIKELESYPVLTKPLMTENFDRMISDEWRGQILRKQTGGSSGTPFEFGYTMESYARRTAMMWRCYAWGGADIGTKTAYLWGTGQRQTGPGVWKDRLYHYAFNRRFLNVFAMHENNIESFVQQIVDYRPRAVIGYVAPVLLVARWLNARGRQLRGIDGVLTGAEMLFEPERREIGKAFGAPVTNTYGSREFMLMASECEKHEGLHVNSDHLVLEVVDSDSRNVSGASGDILVTDLHNYGMPFVRYRNGDRATRSDHPCSCGRALPLLASVDGRILETILTPDGSIVPGAFFVAVMLGWQQVKQYLFVQTAPDELEVQLVADSPLAAEHMESIRSKVQSRMGERMRVTVRQLKEIPPSRSGKRRVSIAYDAAKTRAQ